MQRIVTLHAASGPSPEIDSSPVTAWKDLARRTLGNVRQDLSLRAGFAYQYDLKFESLLSYEVIGLGTRAVTFGFNGWQIQKPLGEKRFPGTTIGTAARPCSAQNTHWWNSMSMCCSVVFFRC